MRAIVLLAIGALSVSGCSETPVSPTAMERGATTATRHASSHAGTLTVDDDANDCPNADYSTIQAAVDAADPGMTILVCAGIYNERVVISGAGKIGLGLLAKGAPNTVVLDGNNPSPALPFNHAFHLLNVHDVLIEGFSVREYFENIKMTGGGGHTIRKNRTTAAGHDGIFALNSTDNVIEHNVSFDNPSANACGINIAGSESVGNLLRHNQLTNNNWGIRIQGGATGTVAFNNDSRANRSHGIQNIGATTNGSTIEDNRVNGNPIGIAVNASSDVLVTRNHAFDNTTFDLVDTGANTTFINNHCTTSSPAGLCAHGGGNSN